MVKKNKKTVVEETTPQMLHEVVYEPVVETVTEYTMYRAGDMFVVEKAGRVVFTSSSQKAATDFYNKYK